MFKLLDRLAAGVGTALAFGSYLGAIGIIALAFVVAPIILLLRYLS